MEIAPERQIDILERLGFGVAKEHEGIEVWVPSWRPDVLGEADLVEEIARVTSLTKLEGRPLPKTNTGVTGRILTPNQRRASTARRALAQAGFNECVTYAFIDETAATCPTCAPIFCPVCCAQRPAIRRAALRIWPSLRSGRSLQAASLRMRRWWPVRFWLATTAPAIPAPENPEHL